LIKTTNIPPGINTGNKNIHDIFFVGAIKIIHKNLEVNNGIGKSFFEGGISIQRGL
jgi:hypothetical protein